ncbi:AfsR/SARP family transcriptional regulator [Lentzea aerocolonigenes]|uniref:AfsR/SARP family transcriptional regulator n=1 Tax=Lentzea aerocolonigenes TaxID=68170 RepID=UPI0004C3D04D|nr:BTAD domain-containing putative transcriptional regulator [Lentzea aerocolonigenes]MCP2248863.1 DNA-binding transcriptional activator of the SARP family [Lentzea aerocolonigenes]
MTAEYRVLGPLEVLLDGAVVPVPAGRCRVLLATLLLRPNEFVSVDDLVERVWDGSAPQADRARRSLHMVVRRLRVALGDADCVRTLAGGYQAAVEPDQLDLLRFRSLVRSGDVGGAVALVRGPVLGDVSSDVLHRQEVPLVTEEWLGALERRIDADLASGRGPELVAELRSLTNRHPFREPLWAGLMRALAESGQQAEALTAYQQIRTLLGRELGIDPGEGLRAVHQQVLSGSVKARGPAPQLLPTAMPRFVGRSAQLRELTGLVSGGPVVAAITGTAGVGKTMLAVHWAHGVAGRFPDGQLHVNLRGFDRHREPMTPGEVLSRFLEALGVTAERIPADVEAQGAMYRDLVADRRMLVVLDNARDAEHVRPLLPGASPSLVLITSRDRLEGLGARQLAFDVLDRDEARALLISRLGEARVDAAADELVVWCGGLPLALAIVAARAAETPDLPLSALVAELADERTRLDSLDTGDAATSVRTVFQWSYQQLSPAAARMFRLIAVHPGPDVSVPALTSLVGAPAEEDVRELVQANLLVEHVPGRFTCHDLLRVYAADRAAADETTESRAEAEVRMFDHYVHTLAWIDREYNWGERRFDGFPDPRVSSETFPDQAASVDWFDAERAVLRALVALADERGLDGYTWQLPWFGAPYVDRFAIWRDWIAQLGRGSHAAARAGERRVAAKLLFLQALGYARLAQYERSMGLFESSRRAFEELGNIAEQVRAQSAVAWVLGLLERPREALEVARNALELQRSDPAADPDRIAMALHQVANALLEAGESAEALDHLAEWEAINRAREVSPISLGVTAVTRSKALLALGETTGVVETLHDALGWFEQMGGGEDRAAAQDVLGDAHRSLGDLTEARRWWIKALEFFEQHQHPDADKVRAKLAALPGN